KNEDDPGRRHEDGGVGLGRDEKRPGKTGQPRDKFSRLSRRRRGSCRSCAVLRQEEQSQPKNQEGSPAIEQGLKQSGNEWSVTADFVDEGEQIGVTGQPIEGDVSRRFAAQNPLRP